MTENKGSGASTDQGGAKDQPKKVDEPKKPSEKMVKFDDHKRALDDLHRFKSQSKESETTINDLQAKLQSNADAKMASEGKKDELLESYKQRLEDSEKKREAFKESFFDSKKKDAVYASALKAGLRKDAEPDLELLTLDGVSVERTDQGRVIVHGADDFIAAMKQTRRHWFKDSAALRINSGGAGGDIPKNTALTPEYMNNLELSDPLKYKALMPKFLEQRRQ